MIKVLLDARKLGDGGIGTYLHNLITGLQAHDQISLNLLVAKNKPNFFFSSQKAYQIQEDSKPYSVDELWFLGRRLSKHCQSDKCEIFHEPHFTLPGGLSIPSVITVHDLIHISNPERWYYPFMAKFLIQKAIKQAKRIIVVSEASKLALLQTFPDIEFLPKKLRVIPNAISQDLLQTSLNWRELLPKRFELGAGYLLALFSMLKPHKGFSDLTEAYRQAKMQSSVPKLVVAGKGVGELMKSEPKAIEELEKQGICCIGEVSQEDLILLYKGARATILPSRTEGFGLSALESKVIGTPVIARPLPSLSTILDDEDLICQDMSLKSLVTVLAAADRIFPAWSERSINLKLAAEFSIESLTSKTIEVYKEALECQ